MRSADWYPRSSKLTCALAGKPASTTVGGEPTATGYNNGTGTTLTAAAVPEFVKCTGNTFMGADEDNAGAGGLCTAAELWNTRPGAAPVLRGLGDDFTAAAGRKGDSVLAMSADGTSRECGGVFEQPDSANTTGIYHVNSPHNVMFYTTDGCQSDRNEVFMLRQMHSFKLNEKICRNQRILGTTGMVSSL